MVDAPREAGERAGEQAGADEAGDPVAEALARVHSEIGVARIIVRMSGRLARPARIGLQP